MRLNRGEDRRLCGEPVGGRLLQRAGVVVKKLIIHRFFCAWQPSNVDVDTGKLYYLILEAAKAMVSYGVFKW